MSSENQKKQPTFEALPEPSSKALEEEKKSEPRVEYERLDSSDDGLEQHNEAQNQEDQYNSDGVIEVQRSGSTHVRLEQSWEMIADHFGGGTGDTMDPMLQTQPTVAKHAFDELDATEN